MNHFLFETGSRIVFGSGCVREYLASFLRDYGPNVLLLTDETGEASRAMAEIERVLNCAGKQTVGSTVGPFCPRHEQIQRAAHLCLEHHVDLILGVGGSAALDGCKAAALAAVCRGELWHNFFLCQGVVDIQPLAIGYVSTSVEPGAVNGAAGLMREGRCIWRDYPGCDPVLALLDPVYTRGLTGRQLARQGCSALAGALELYLQPAEDARVSQDLLETLIRRMVRDLRTCFRDPEDDGARSDLMWENALWGSRFYQLGRRFSFPALPMRELALQVAEETGGGYAEALAVLLLARCRREAQGRAADLARLWRDLGLPAEPGELEQAAQERVREAALSKNLLIYTA